MKTTTKSVYNTIDLGYSTGTLAARSGDNSVNPPKGSPFCIEYRDLFGHVGVMGDVGSGKVPLVLKRLSSSVASVNQMGMMLIDYKAVLPFELLEQFKKDLPEKVAEKLRIIGTEDSDYSFNPLDGVRPGALKGLVQSVMEQMEQEAACDYFHKASYQLLEHAARISKAWQLTKGGKEWTERTGRKTYNLMTMADIILCNDIRMEICKDVADALWNLHLSSNEYALDSSNLRALKDSLSYMAGTGEGTWSGMSDREKSGVLGTFKVIISKLKSSPELSERFFEGRIGDKCLSIPEAIENGYIVLLGISPEEEGLAGTLLAHFAKHQVIFEAMRRQTQLMSEGKDPLVESPFCLMINNAEMFVSSGDFEMSDAKILSAARSSGLSIIYGFQNINSLEKRIGKENTKDVMANLTTKLTLANHDFATAKYFSESSGHHKGQPLISVSEVAELPPGYAIAKWRIANQEHREIVSLLPGIN